MVRVSGMAACKRIVSAGFCLALAAQPPSFATDLAPLDPVGSFRLDSLARQPRAGIRVLQARMDGQTLWFLAGNRENSHGSELLQTTLGGELRSRTPLGNMRGSSFALLDSKAVVSGVAGKRRVLRFYAAGQQAGTDVGINCTAWKGVLALAGRAATLCPDGTLTEYADRPVRSRVSWARSGTHAAALNQQELLVVDAVTAQVMLEHLENGTLTPLNVQSKALEQARNKIESALRSALEQGAPSDSRRPMSVTDVATAGETIWLLVGTYDWREGPTIVRLDRSGRVLGEYLCRTPKADSTGMFLYLAAGANNVALASTKGEVYVYRAENP